MANKKELLADQLRNDQAQLVRMQEEQQTIESKPTHVGFRDASRRAKLVHEGEALNDSIQKERERLADGAILPQPVK